MARFTSKIRYSSCKSQVCTYSMKGKIYQRSKSSLTGERVKTDPVFKNTMMYAQIMKHSGHLSSLLHRKFSPRWKRKVKYKRLVSMAFRFFEKGYCTQEVWQLLIDCSGFETNQKAKVKTENPKVFNLALEAGV